MSADRQPIWTALADAHSAYSSSTNVGHIPKVSVRYDVNKPSAHPWSVNHHIKLRCHVRVV